MLLVPSNRHLLFKQVEDTSALIWGLQTEEKVQDLWLREVDKIARFCLALHFHPGYLLCPGLALLIPAKWPCSCPSYHFQTQHLSRGEAVHSRMLFQRPKKPLPPKACQQICLHYVTCCPFSLMGWGLSRLDLVIRAFPESQEWVPGSQSCVGVERMSRQNWSSALCVGRKDKHALKFSACKENTILSWTFFFDLLHYCTYYIYL